jgi:hypothetical protein
MHVGGHDIPPIPDAPGKGLDRSVPWFRNGTDLLYIVASFRQWGMKCRYEGTRHRQLKEELREENRILWLFIRALWSIVVYVFRIESASSVLFTVLRPLLTPPGVDMTDSHRQIFCKVTRATMNQIYEMEGAYEAVHEEYDLEKTLPRRSRKFSLADPETAVPEAISSLVPKGIPSFAHKAVTRQTIALMESCWDVVADPANGNLNPLSDELEQAENSYILGTFLLTRDNRRHVYDPDTAEWKHFQGTK